MTPLKTKIEEKQHVAEGLLTEAKGVVREQWGNLTNDERSRLTGKKEQILGRFQANHGDKVALTRDRRFLYGVAAALLFTALALRFSRKNQSA